MSYLEICEGFAGYPKVDLIGGETPLQRASSLERALSREGIITRIYLKRDDLMPLGGGGNKLRKLQYHMAAILREGHDTVITFGGLQSNHARLTAAVCAIFGIECHLILTRQVDITTEDYEHNGNRLLNRLFGAISHVPDDNVTAGLFSERLVKQLKAQGRSVAVIPTGGSTALGAIGYAECAAEIYRQAADADIEFSNIFLANGSGGTQAGLVAGANICNKSADAITGFSVLHSAAKAQAITDALVMSAFEQPGMKKMSSAVRVNIDDSQRGTAYGQPTPDMKEAVRLMAQTEGFLLDPVYSGKAFAGMLSRLRKGNFNAKNNVLFVMTGGAAGLYAYRSHLG